MMHTIRADAARGFTLVELVFLIVVLGAGLVAIVSSGGEAAKRVGDNRGTGIAVQLAQEKGEAILADRRNPNRGYAYVTTSNYASETVSGYTRTVAVTDYSTNAICYSSTQGCKQVVVTVSSGSTTAATVTFVVANYQ